MQVIQAMKQLGYTKPVAHDFELMQLVDCNVSVNWVVEGGTNLSSLFSGGL